MKIRTKRWLALIPLSFLFLTGCGSAVTSTPAAGTVIEESRSLNVFAAASLTDAFTEIGENFEASHPGMTVTFNFAGSQALRTQIEEGAPADVFASANTKEMDMLVSGGYITDGERKIFLTNKLVVIIPASNPAALTALADLAKPGIKLVLAAEEVPVGKYARQSLDAMSGQFGSDFKDKVLANIVSNEDNVRQVVAKIQLGEADAGIVYTSDAVAAPDLKTIEIPDGMNVIAQYPIAPVVRSSNVDLARAFIEYVLSPDGRAVLQKWGFSPVQ